ncbi:MAG: hypothetical protein ACKOWF_00625, partial [Chloroflexota bacterium]
APPARGGTRRPRPGAGAGPRPPPPPAKPAQRLAAGQKVFHNKFGEGVILEAVERRDGDQELVIAFTRHGQKRLLASFANLDPIGDD